MEEIGVTTPNWDIDSWICSKQYIDYSVEFISDELNLDHSSHILDIGCGRGSITTAIAEYNCLTSAVDAVDISDAINDAVATDRVTFYQEDVLDFLNERRVGYYDSAIIKQVIHLIPTEKRAPFFFQLQRCLKPGGRALVLMMPVEYSMPMFSRGKQTFNQETFTRNDVIRYAHQYGFKTALSHFNFEVKISKQDYFSLLSRRFMSNLRTLTDEEIEKGLEELNALYPSEQLLFFDTLDAIHLNV